MARRKANDLENQMSLMDMMASESPEYTEEGPEELLDPGEDMGDSEGQTDKPFKLVANKTTKAKASISTQALSVVKAVYADTVETNWEELFDGFDRLYAITFSSGIEFVNKVINKFSYAEVVFGCEKIIASDIAAIMSVQIDSVQRLAKSKSAGNLANRLDDGSLQLYVSRDTKSHEKIFILESADHKRVRVITGSANMRGINTKDILRHPFAIRENNCTVGEISVIHTKTGFLQGYNSIAMQLYGEEYQSYKIGFGKEGVCCPVFLGGQQIAQINKSAVVKDNLDEYLIYAVNEKALMPSVMFAIYIDGIYYANRGMYVDDATTINCEYSLNEEVLSHYDPNFVKGL